MWNDTCFIEESKKLRYLQTFIMGNQKKFKKLKESLGSFKVGECLYRSGGHLVKVNIMCVRY